MAAITPNTSPQCTSVPGMLPNHVGGRPISRVDGLLRLAGSRISYPSTQMIEDGECDVDQKQGSKIVFG